MLRAILMIVLLGAVPALAQAPFASFDRASEPVLGVPYDLSIGPDGLLYVAERNGGRIAILDPETLDLLGTAGAGQLPAVRDISFGPDGTGYAAVAGANAVAVFDLRDGEFELRNYMGSFARTEGVLAHSNGRLYVMASGAGQLVGLDGTELAALVSGLTFPHDVAEAPDGSLWVADTGRRRLVRYSPELEELQVIEGVEYGFAGPRYLDVDDFGRVVVADPDAHRVLLIDPATGGIEGVMGDGSPGLGPYKFNRPLGALTVGNQYFFADSANNRVVKYVVLVN